MITKLYIVTRQLTAPSPRKAMRMAVGAFFFLQGLCFSSWASRIPTIQQSLNLNHATLGSMLFALPLGLVTSLLVSNVLINRFGNRKILIISTIFYGSVLPLIGLAVNHWQLMGILCLLGLSGNLSNIAMNIQAVALESTYRRPIMASFHGLNSLAGFAGAAFGMACLSLDVSPFIHFSSIGLVVYIAVFIMHRHILANTEGHNTTSTTFAWPDSRLLTLAVVVFCGMICEGTLFDWSGVYFEKVVRVPKELTNIGYLAFMYTMAAGRFVGDWLAGRIGVRKLIQINGLLISAGLALAVFLPYLQTATFGFLLVGAGVSTIVPLVYSYIGKLDNRPVGNALMAVSSLGYMGFLIGPPLIGLLAQLTSLRWAFALIALLGICIACLINKFPVSTQLSKS